MSTITNLTYGGLATTPPDDSALDGTLSLSLNAIHEDAALRPVPQPTDITTETLGELLNLDTLPIDRIYCIHQVAGEEHYVYGRKANVPNVTLLTLHYAVNGVSYILSNDITDRRWKNITQVTPIGNVLVVISDAGLDYFLWSGNNGYKYLGSHIPELSLRFNLLAGDAISDTRDFSKEWDGSKQLDSLMASLNSTMAQVAENVYDKTNYYRFGMPFMIRYAYRLYDGTITMQSAPALIHPTTSDNNCLVEYIEAGDGKKTITTTITPYALRYFALSRDQLIRLKAWKDIVTAVEFYISPLFYTYNQAGRAEDIKITGLNQVAPPYKDFMDEAVKNGSFYHLASIPLGKIYLPSFINSNIAQPDWASSNQSPAKTDNEPIVFIEPEFVVNNNNIQVRTTLEDDYYSHDSLLPQYSTAYNSRLNLTCLQRKPFAGFNLSCMSATEKPLSSDSVDRYFIEINVDGRVYYTEYVNAPFCGNDRTGFALPDWFFYPNPNAVALYIGQGDFNFNGETYNQSFRRLPLTPHPHLNGAYATELYKNNDAAQLLIADRDAKTIIPLPNKIYTSEVNNPFHFPLLNIYTVGAGEVMGIATAAKALSQGQFGQFPLYAFTSEGVWAMELSATGTYSARQPISRDVCNNPASITQIDSAVLFTTARGLMLISGSELIPLTDAIFAPDFHPATQLPHFGNLVKEFNRITGASLDASTIAPLTPFNEFLLNCRISYDYINQRIILFSNDPGIRYAYIYSLKSKLWGMMLTEATNAVPSYPEALATTADGRLLNFSERSTSGTTPVLAVTRPFTVDHSDGLSTIDTIIQRGTFARGHVAQALYGSRDLLNWFVVWSSNNEYLRGMRGTPYKYFRLALISNLGNEESLSGAAIAYNERQRNRLR